MMGEAAENMSIVGMARLASLLDFGSDWREKLGVWEYLITGLSVVISGFEVEDEIGALLSLHPKPILDGV
jgi:hypothetical protein